MLHIKERLTQALEVILVLLLAFGLPIYSSTLHALNPPLQTEINDEGILELLTFEMLTTGIILLIFKSRGIQLKQFLWLFQWNMIWIGLSLVVLRLLIGEFGNWLWAQTPFAIPNNTTFTLSASLLPLALLIVFNSIYEEFFLLGYLHFRMHRLGIVTFIALSSLIRFSYHTYQGWASAPMLLPMGILFSIYYFKPQKLWPPILAHAMGNTFLFLNMQYNWINL
jgi:membrane protease YdiL (CAAX protease family)